MCWERWNPKKCLPFSKRWEKSVEEAFQLGADKWWHSLILLMNRISQQKVHQIQKKGSTKQIRIWIDKLHQESQIYKWGIL